MMIGNQTGLQSEEAKRSPFLDGPLKYPSQQTLIKNYDFYRTKIPKEGLRDLYKIRVLASRTLWKYLQWWGDTYTITKLQDYITLVLETLMLLKATNLESSLPSGYVNACLELLDMTPDYDEGYVEMYYRTAILPPEQRDEERHEYERRYGPFS